MSRRVPRTLRTLKLDYREIAALLLFPLASLSPPPPAPRAARFPPASSTSSKLLFVHHHHQPSRSQSPSCRSHRLHRHERQNLPGGPLSWALRFESDHAAVSAYTCFARLCRYLSIYVRVRASGRIRACETCVSVSPTQLTACGMERDDTARHF